MHWDPMAIASVTAAVRSHEIKRTVPADKPELRSSKSEIRKKSEDRRPKQTRYVGGNDAQIHTPDAYPIRPSDFGLLSDFADSDFGIWVDAAAPSEHVTAIGYTVHLGRSGGINAAVRRALDPNTPRYFLRSRKKRTPAPLAFSTV